MAADPEPRDLILLKQPNGSVPKVDAHRVDRFTGVNLLELQARMVRVLSKEPVGLPRSPCARVREVRGTPPRIAECRANSQVVGIYVCCAAGGSIRARFGGELAQCVLRRFERTRPLLLVGELLKQPKTHTVLLLRRKGRQLRDRRVKRSGHDSSIADGSRMGDRACPECLQNVGRFQETPGNSGEAWRNRKSLRNKPLSPEVARHHHLENTR